MKMGDAANLQTTARIAGLIGVPVFFADAFVGGVENKTALNMYIPLCINISCHLIAMLHHIKKVLPSWSIIAVS